MNLKDYVASIVDFPKKGIIFRDVTPIMQDKDAYLYTTNCLSKLVKQSNANVVIGPEEAIDIYSNISSLISLKPSFIIVLFNKDITSSLLFALLMRFIE